MAVSQGPCEDPLRAQSELKNTFNFEHHSFSGMPHPLCVMPLDFSNGIFHLSLSLSLCHVTYTHTQSFSVLGLPMAEDNHLIPANNRS